MRDALLQDISCLPYSVSTTVDARLRPPKHCECVAIKAEDDVWQVWKAHIEQADAVWFIAPETNGMLYALTQMATLQVKLVLGCGLDAIEITSDKMATYLALKAASIATIPTYYVDNWPKHNNALVNQPLLAKPNDGAGCEDTFCFVNAENLMHWLLHNKKQHTHVIQPFITGTPASISCVMLNGSARLLSCNTQMIELNHHTLCFKGVVVNGMREHWQAFELVAQQIAISFPSLAGFVGIDVIVRSNEIIVVEINTRLTTSYVGMREATGVNPAELILNTLTKPDYEWPSLQQNMVTIHV